MIVSMCDFFFNLYKAVHVASPAKGLTNSKALPKKISLNSIFSPVFMDWRKDVNTWLMGLKALFKEI